MKKQILRNLVIGYLVVLLVLWAGLYQCYANHALMFVSPSDRLPGVLALMMLAGGIGLFILFMVIGIGFYVNGDSRLRGMNPALWTVIAVFIPYFVGLIAYLILRKPLPASCPACKRSVMETASFCPHCGLAMKRKCPACQSSFTEDYKFCPSCGAAIEQK